jgi:hypothetical protein
MTTVTAVQPPTREDRFKSVICAIAEDRNLSKRQRNEKIAEQVLGYLSLAGTFILSFDEVYFEHRKHELLYPLASFSTERQRGDLLDSLGVYHNGSYRAWVAAAVGKLALESVAAIGDPQFDENF